MSGERPKRGERETARLFLDRLNKRNIIYIEQVDSDERDTVEMMIACHIGRISTLLIWCIHTVGFY